MRLSRVHFSLLFPGRYHLTIWVTVLMVSPVLYAPFWSLYSQEARLFGPAIFEASKLCVLFLGVDQEKHPEHVPRSYTLTHSDITAEITLAVAKEINKAQVVNVACIVHEVYGLSFPSALRLGLQSGRSQYWCSVLLHSVICLSMCIF